MKDDEGLNGIGGSELSMHVIEETPQNKHHKASQMNQADWKDTMKRNVWRQFGQQLHHEQRSRFCVGHLWGTLVQGCCVGFYCWGLYQNGSETGGGERGSHYHRRLAARHPPSTLWMLESSDGSYLVDWDTHFPAHIGSETIH